MQIQSLNSNFLMNKTKTNFQQNTHRKHASNIMFTGESVCEDACMNSSSGPFAGLKIVSHGYKSPEAKKSFEQACIIKEQMEKYRSSLQDCFDNRLNALKQNVDLALRFRDEFPFVSIKKTDDVITSVILTAKNGKVNECVYDVNGKLKYAAIGIKKGEKSTRINEFCCYDSTISCGSFIKFNNLVVSGEQCIFRDGVVKEGNAPSTFSASEHNKRVALEEFFNFTEAF